MKERKITASGILAYGVLIAYLVVVVYPMLWVVATSLKHDREIFLLSLIHI